MTTKNTTPKTEAEVKSALLETAKNAKKEVAKTEKATGKKATGKKAPVQEQPGLNPIGRRNAKKTGGKGGNRKFPLTAKITLLTKENPKREGTHAHTKFALYSKHKTVSEYLKAGGTSSSLIWDTEHGYIKIAE